VGSIGRSITGDGTLGPEGCFLGSLSISRIELMLEGDLGKVGEWGLRSFLPQSIPFFFEVFA
jgi:hypothetical protein